MVIGSQPTISDRKPGSNKEIKDFCETNFGITFPMTEKLNVIGSDSTLSINGQKKDFGIGAIPKWNFHKNYNWERW